MKIQPKPIQKLTCPKCGELQIKVYPWSMFQINLDNGKGPICGKCLNNPKLFSPDLARLGMVER